MEAGRAGRAADVAAPLVTRAATAIGSPMAVAPAAAVDLNDPGALRPVGHCVLDERHGRSRDREGSHYSGGDSVTLAVDDPKDDRPILLHDDVHVYQFRKLPDGRNKPDILTDYGRAKAGNLYPAGAYLRKYQGEFYAMTASVYLHGHLAREPFTRDELRRKQPAYDRCLSRLLGQLGT